MAEFFRLFITTEKRKIDYQLEISMSPPFPFHADDILLTLYLGDKSLNDRLMTETIRAFTQESTQRIFQSLGLLTKN